MSECEFDPPSPRRDVTLEEIDSTLSQIASNSAFSSFEIRQQADGRTHDQLLAPILRRLSSCEAKWLVRMILKSYLPVQIPERTAMTQFHFLLPSIMSIQDSIAAAIDFFAQPDVSQLPHDPENDAANAFRNTMLKSIKPRLGTMVKRQPYEKARSIKHCCEMANKRLMSVERKYDGEYCQVHIDTSLTPASCIQIFSKSGKNSTDDRFRLHGAIRDSLQLDRPGCRIQRKCILEGELLVCNRITTAIEPFHKIRRHVMHGRRFLGVEADSPPSVDEHLMIMFYDLLVLDDKLIAQAPHFERRKRLKAVVRPIPGMAQIGERELINFGSSRARDQLRTLFAKSITNGWEGFVLKGYHDPYFSLPAGPRSIKLKKDYITALGDSADLCIIGGRAEPKLVNEFNLHGQPWTTFYVACLENKAEVVRFDGKPRMKIIDTINSHGIPRNDILELNKQGQFMELPFALDQDEYNVEMAVTGTAPPSTLFRRPIVVEIMGAGFDKNSSCDFYTVRFPRLSRLHLDRNLKDSMTFAELQDMARAKETGKPSMDSQEDAKWTERLEKADGKNKYLVDKSQSTSPGETPLSPESISISPSPMKRTKPPVFVRTDTRELSQHEVEARRQSQHTTSPSITTSVSAVTCKSKRKASQTTPTPASSNASKRPRLKSTRQVVKSTPLPQTSQEPSTTLVEVPRTDTGRGPSSSQIVAPGLPTSSTRSRRSQSTREPLAEMNNVSLELQRPRMPQSGLLADRPDPSKDKVQDNTIATNPRVTTAMEKVKDATRSHFPHLPTPPTSSAESAAADKSKSTARAQKHHEHTKSTSASAPGHPGRDVQTPNVDLISPVYVSTSVAAKDSSYGLTSCLHQLLQQSTFAFTYSSSCFIRNMFRNITQRHIVLINVSEPRAVADDILELGSMLVNCPQVHHPTLRAVIVFVDSSFLISTTSGQNKAILTKHLENAFCAALEFGPDIIDGNGRRAAKVSWDTVTLNQA